MRKIAVVNDMSGLGRCSLTAAIPVLSVLGLECCPLPTAVLSNQTGYDSFFCADFTGQMEAYIAEWRKRRINFDGILTGYLASARQADTILAFLEEFKTENTLYVCDPVMADDGRVYDTYDDALCGKIKMLAGKADVITPNLTELCILTGVSYKMLTDESKSAAYMQKIADTASGLLCGSVHTAVVTGIHIQDEICNLIVTENGFSAVCSKRFGGSYSGTGDLFASVLMGELVRGKPAQYAVEKAVRFLEASISESYVCGTDRNDGVNFQNHLEMLFDEKDKPERPVV